MAATDASGEGERHIRLAGSSNLRDIGGYPGAGGRTVRWGKIYRSGAMLRLGDEDWRWMEERKIATLCDLRSPDERELAPTRWRGPAATQHIEADYSAEHIFGGPSAPAEGGALNDMHRSLYGKFAELLAQWFREMFAALLAGRAPLIVHCSAGQDRTGLAIGLILTALGTPRAVIFDDYLLSTGYRRTENELDRAGLAQFEHRNVVARFYTTALRERGPAALQPGRLVDKDGNPLLLLAFAMIEERWGSVFAYLEYLGVGAAEIAKLKTLYLEPAD